jgi:replication factor A1
MQMNSEIESSEEKSEASNEVKVAELETRMSNIDISFKVLEKGDVREVSSRRDGSINRVASAIVGDETGIVTLPLWNDMIEVFEAGKTYALKNAYTGLFRGNLRLKIGRDSEINEREEEITDVKMDNDLSEADHGRPRRRHYYQGYSSRSYGSDRGRYGGSYRGRSSRDRRDYRRRRGRRY